MADSQKPVEVTETSPVVTETVATTVETTQTENPGPATETTSETAAPVAPEASTEAAAVKEETKDKDTAVKESAELNEGTLEHKGAAAGFPKNLLFNKNHFWFGTDPVPTEKLATYLKSEKASDVAHNVASWASHTGKGLLFYSKAGDKTVPTGAIPLADATEPTTEGPQKFFITSRGNKHAFKAPTQADRDAWVAQLKVKIAEANELATTVTESETYKKTLESLKPAKKETSTVAAAAEPGTESTLAADATAAESSTPETPKERGVKEDTENKRRSASRKRGSIFGNLLGKKEDKKEDDVLTPVTAAEPAPGPSNAAPSTDATAEAAKEEDKKEDKKEEVATKPTPNKRASIFGNFTSSFTKKKAGTPEATSPAVESADPVAESAPVIPAVEGSEPLSTDVASPTAVAPETVEAAAATNGDSKKKSLPFNNLLRKFTVKKSDSSTEKAEDKVADATEPTPAVPAKVEGASSTAPAAPAAPAAAPTVPTAIS